MFTMTKSKLVLIILLVVLFGCRSRTRQVHNIETFARVYGYVRWFHPGDAAQEVSWNKMAVLGIRKVKDVRSDEELRDSLLSLFSPLVEGLEIGKEKDYRDGEHAVLTAVPAEGSYVAWQHYGVYLGEKSNIYKSARTNRPSSNIFSAFGYYLFSDSAKEIKVRGRLKVEQGDSTGQAWFFLHPVATYEGARSDTGMMLRNSARIGSADWKDYELAQSLNIGVQYIAFGCLVENNSSVLAAHFDISKEGGKWERVDFETGEIDKKHWNKSEVRHKIELVPADGTSAKYVLKAAYTGKLFDKTPAPGELISEPIGSNLHCVIPMSVESNRTASFLKEKEQSLKKLKDELSGLKQSSPEINLASVVIAWNAFQHFYPYFDVIKTDWQQVLPETLAKTMECTGKADFMKVLCEMAAALEDGHGYVRGEAMYHLPIRTELIEGNIVVTASNTSLIKAGDIIRKVNGMDAMKVQSEMESLISGSPQLKRYRALNVFGSSFEPGLSKLELERNKGIVRCEVQRQRKVPKSIFYNGVQERLAVSEQIKELEPGIFYMNTTTCSDVNWLKNTDKLARAKSVIYDFRFGGRLIDLIPHLTDSAVNSAWWNIPEVTGPDRKNMTFGKTNWSVKPAPPRFKSKSIVLISPFNVSNNETTLGIINAYKLATTVGSQTAGCNGNVNVIDLPCGYPVRWTGMKVLKHDGSQHHLIGFIPDYPVERTLKGLMEGRDEVLEKALEVARQ